MLKFFRRIRRRFLTENQYSKYFIYAVGEILLVVIGILIALQINSWNQYKKERLEEYNILIRLEKDLQNDLKNIHFLYQNNERLIQDLKFLIKGMSDRNLTIEDFVNHNSRMPFFTEYEKIKGTYNETIAAGKLSLILNDSLRDLILKFYERQDFSADLVTHHQMQDYIIPGFFNTLGYTKEYAFAVSTEPNNFNSVDLESIYENTVYRSILTSKLGLLNEQVRQWKVQQKSIEGLLENLQQEIKERWSK